MGAKDLGQPEQRSAQRSLVRPASLFPGRVRAQGKAKPAESFVVLLKGIYQPVVHGPNLGLSSVDLSIGSYSTTKIYPVCGTPGDAEDLVTAIGDYHVNAFTGGDLCAYHIPGELICDAVHRKRERQHHLRRSEREFPHRNLRARRHRGNRDLSIHCRRPRPHGRPTTFSPMGTLTNTASAHHQRPIAAVEIGYHRKARSGGRSTPRRLRSHRAHQSRDCLRRPDARCISRGACGGETLLGSALFAVASVCARALHNGARRRRRA